MLGLTFANEADYDLIKEDDTFNFIDLAGLCTRKATDFRGSACRWYSRYSFPKPYLQCTAN